MRKLFLIMACLLVVVATGAVADGSDSSEGPAPGVSSALFKSPGIELSEPDLHTRFVEGILLSRSIEVGNKGERKPYWFECGKRIKGKAARQDRASAWATGILEAIDSANEAHGVELNPWGVFATTHNESGFNVCALDLQTRQWAVEQGLVEHLRQTYTRDTVYKIISSKQFKKTRIKADMGPMQVRRNGNVSRAMLDQILSLEPGMVWAVKEMADRSVDYPVTMKGTRRPHPRPWKLWPTTNARSLRSAKYDRTITRVAKWLGAKPGEI